MYKKYITNRLNEYISNDNVIYLNNQNTNFMLNHIVADYYKFNKTIYVIMPSLYDAQKAYDELTNMINEEDVLFYPQDELVAVELLDVQGDFKYERINTMLSLLKNDKPYIVVMNINAAIKLQMNKDRWNANIININKNTIINEQKLYEKLIEMGYTYSYTVTKTGEFSHRGSIIDIFPLNYINPIRLDLFGDEIDVIKEFDLETQKSISQIKEFNIYPVTEMMYSDAELLDAQREINTFIAKNVKSDAERDKFYKDLNNLGSRNGIDNLIRFVRFFDSKPITILDVIEDKRTYLIDITKSNQTYEHMIDDLGHFCEEIGGHNIFNLNYFKDFDYVKSIADVISEGVVDTFEKGIDYFVTVPSPFMSNRDAILKYIKAHYQDYTLICVVKNSMRLDYLKEDLLDNGVYYTVARNEKDIKMGQVNIITGQTTPSFKSDLLKLIVLNESVLFEIKYEHRKPKYKSIYKNTTKISKHDELSINDYVVHFDYGIGRYKGLDVIENKGILRDFIKIEYDMGSVLHIPLEEISQIEKYTLGDEKQVKLSKLGTKSWSQAKERVRKKLAQMSADLIRLYAERQASEGFEFMPDTDDQVLFEADFGYDLTMDQEKSIIEIKKEMETPRVMDRLVCGDVGYGKTEVALRAAFKAVQSGKQVAVLAPTTILSRQHYYTFKNRMDRFGVRVDLVNRLQSPKSIKNTLAGLKSGEVDVVIGTHKLLGKDIVYKDLGLLIVDEEQRFGVLQKEKIKELKVNVDTLTLSATPIPRTLQMSMMGIKSLSMLETPPKNRYPIQTYVLERNQSIIRDAIMRELARGGQVFYMYNNTHDIDILASKLQILCPDARICVGHGKMDKQELEDVICDFIDKKYNVLVCTTIIETGIDMPDANTLIVHDANLLGLSQLYQLRGRVGRSDKIAYAYLMYGQETRLTDLAIKRLETIKEFNELGSGFKIAMRDLAIRGAGDILGESQSGFIESIGLETYLHILEEEITKMNKPLDIGLKEEIDPSLRMVYSDRTISNDYINNEDVKIEMHKKIDKIKSLQDLEELSDEFRDRFGKFDNTIRIYMYEKLLNKYCHKLEIKKILDTKSQMILFMSKEKTATMNGVTLFEKAYLTSNAINLHYYNKQIEIIVDKTMLKNNEHIVTLTKFLDKLL